jgi:hypothetical protein
MVEENACNLSEASGTAASTFAGRAIWLDAYTPLGILSIVFISIAKREFN